MSTKTNTAQVDVRGPQFTAWVTTGVLVATLITAAFSPIAAAVILGIQTVVFAVGAWRGPRQHPYGLIFARLVAPRLGPVTEREPVPPLKFAQLVGFVFAAVGVVGFASGIQLLGLLATGFALVAAFLNAAFGICLGCQIYPLVARLTQSPSNRKEFVHGS
jgi:membrane associated rhomboid family serine protease